MQSNTITLAFAAFLLSSLLVRLWLATRQVRHVARNRDAVPAAFAQVVTLEAHQRAAAYTVDKLRFGLLLLAFETAMLLAWTLLGGLNALNAAVQSFIYAHVQGSWAGMAYQLALIASFAAIGGLLDLPFAAWNTFRIEQRHGFNRITPGLWLADLAKSTLIGTLLGLPVIAVVLWLMGAAGSWWWLWAWGVWMGFMLFVQFIFPAFIAPLFNKFEPLQDAGLRVRVEALMQRCGFTASGLFVMDGSRRSAHANAYFTGFGATKRVVFFDTLLSKLSPGEVEAVLAHELGHFRLRHIVKRLATMFALSLGALALLGWLSQQPAFYSGLGVQPDMSVPSDALALLLFLLALPVFGFFVSPMFAAVSRKHEYEADAYACSQASGSDLAAALLKLYEDNASTLTPDPLYVRFYYSHPPASERLAAMKALA
ncbi:MAG: M48 family peptidase [Aquabacterium sp.]|nr:MAG: M48 family peptidase [Aquabacterium sp.]